MITREPLPEPVLWVGPLQWSPQHLILGLIRALPSNYSITTLTHLSPWIEQLECRGALLPTQSLAQSRWVRNHFEIHQQILQLILIYPPAPWRTVLLPSLGTSYSYQIIPVCLSSVWVSVAQLNQDHPLTAFSECAISTISTKSYIYIAVWITLLGFKGKTQTKTKQLCPVHILSSQLPAELRHQRMLSGARKWRNLFAHSHEGCSRKGNQEDKDGAVPVRLWTKQARGQTLLAVQSSKVGGRPQSGARHLHPRYPQLGTPGSWEPEFGSPCTNVSHLHNLYIS